MFKCVSEAEISESLKKVSVLTIFAKLRKVSVSKNPELESWKSLGLDRFENVQSSYSYCYCYLLFYLDLESDAS